MAEPTERRFVRPSRREFLAAAGAGAALATGRTRRAHAAEAPGARPNIVYMMTDDQRWDGMSCAGNRIVRTPHMDRLAAEGVRLKNMFVTNSLCAPSRATFLTGKYSHVHGVRTNRAGLAGQPIFTDRLRKAGYHTCFVGKAHTLHRALRGRFDLYLGFGGQGRYTNPALPGFGGKAAAGTGHVTDLLTDRAVAYLREHRKDPFCLLLWFKSPHRPWVPAERFRTLYRDVEVPDPPAFEDDYAGRPSAIRHTRMRVETAKGRMPFKDWLKDYYRTIAGVHENVGRVLKALDELKLAENTIVVFTSDNGFFLGEHHFFDKRLMYEPSIRIPMLIRWPAGVRPGGRTIDPMCLNTDLAPTLLDLAGLKAPADMQGASWRPLLEGREAPWRKSWYYEYFEYPASHSVRPNRGVRTERWKYIEYPPCRNRRSKEPAEFPAEYELYDLQTDPHEVRNRAGDPSCAAKLAELGKEMARLRKETGDVE